MLSDIGLQTDTILASDFNCCIDKEDAKSKIVFEFLEGKEFILVNEPSLPIYISHNGTSTIFVNTAIKAVEIKILANSQMAS